MMMKMKFLLLAAVATLLASCASDSFVGSTECEPASEGSAAINFMGGSRAVTRGNDATGAAAAKLLGNTFRVYGTMRDGSTESPVIDNYVVQYAGESSIGSDSTNVKGWTYLGLASKGLNPASQTVKYWNLDAAQYNFVAFSGLDDNVRVVSTTSNTINVDQNNLGKLFVSDRVTAKYQASATGKTSNAQYGKVVTLNFKRMAARIRMGLYETIPGYAVKDVKFYYGENYLETAGTSTKDVAGLRGAFPQSGNVVVSYDENNDVVINYEGDDVADHFQFVSGLEFVP